MAGPTSTHPASTDGVVPLYEPSDSNPGWRLPAELDNDRIKGLVKQVDRLEQDGHRARDRQQRHRRAVAELLSPNVRNFLWSRMRAGGFRDTRLGLDWYEATKDDDDMMNELSNLVEDTATESAWQFTFLRLQYAKARLIGGKPLVGDTLFVTALQAYADSRNAFYDKVEPAFAHLTERLRSEMRSASGSLVPSENGNGRRVTDPNEGAEILEYLRRLQHPSE